MEGLFPLVFRAIKKNRTRQQYHCLSSGASLSYINMADICPQAQTQSHVYETASTQKVAHHLNAGNNHNHRHHLRHRSVGDFDYGFSSTQEDRTDGGSPTPKQLVRCGSHRMFSCINGV
ncbi:uncharacterized protein LOC129320778 [Prosopis cineraria]|uniref:uncharacterized protein LOC129320778 n=1 Tax=Prosopis cineraria TaxID=364024 RepID=UPI00240F94BE|nr:uncharacterized protein LOC129320778 [Prosopis cineraria]